MSTKKLARFIRRVIGRQTPHDRLKDEIKRWRKDDGDNILRYQYPLDESSIVWDVGGFEGDFAHEIYERFQPRVFIFEPLTQYYNQCLTRFHSNPSIMCFNFGLSDKNGIFEISIDNNASSFHHNNSQHKKEQAEIRSVIDVFNSLEIRTIDLLKLNIEGGEFEVLPALIDSGVINFVRYLQVQFHNFVPEAESKRELIRNNLSKTHHEMWNYDFVWESWAINK